MSEAPERITAWLSKDGSTRFEGGRLFPAGVEVEYVRADRIEELESENADLKARLDELEAERQSQKDYYANRLILE